MRITCFAPLRSAWSRQGLKVFANIMKSAPRFLINFKVDHILIFVAQTLLGHATTTLVNCTTVSRWIITFLPLQMFKRSGSRVDS